MEQQCEDSSTQSNKIRKYRYHSISKDFAANSRRYFIAIAIVGDGNVEKNNENSSNLNESMEGRVELNNGQSNDMDNI